MLLGDTFLEQKSASCFRLRVALLAVHRPGRRRCGQPFWRSVRSALNVQTQGFAMSCLCVCVVPKVALVAAHCLGAVCPTARAACTGTPAICLCVLAEVCAENLSWHRQAWEVSHRHQLAERPWPKSGSVHNLLASCGVLPRSEEYMCPPTRGPWLWSVRSVYFVKNTTCQTPTRQRDTHVHLFFTCTHQAPYIQTRLPAYMHSPMQARIHTYIHACRHTYIPT